MTAGRLILSSKPVDVDFETRLWTDHGMEFKPGNGARRRERKPDLIVWHWTGTEGTAKTLYHGLLGQDPQLGIEFCVDREGIVWQYCDPTSVDTFDAGSVNRRSIGIEVVSYGYKLQGLPPKVGGDRVQLRERINGSTLPHATFYGVQKRALYKLTEALCKHYGIPFEFPNVKGEIINRTLDSKELGMFSGVVGHFHVSKRKRDPGLEVFTRPL